MAGSRLADRVAIVTGAGSERGMGRAIADAMAREGARIVAVDIDRDGAERTARDIRDSGRDALSLAVDVSNAADVRRMVETTMATFNRIDILVNVAGIARFVPFLETTEETWNQVTAINVRGFFLCSRDVAREMVRAGRGGRIINVNSWGDLPQRAIDWRQGASFAVAQREVYQLTYYLAGRFQRSGTRVLLISSEPEVTALAETLGSQSGNRAILTVGADDACRLESLCALGARVMATGARVVVVGPESIARTVADQLGVEHAAADLASAASLATLFERLGRVDLLVNAAGSHGSGDTIDLSDDEWDRAQTFAVTSYFLTCQAIARQWHADDVTGTIINVAWWGDPRGHESVPGAGRRARGAGDGGPVYGVTKNAARTMTQVMALELARHQITVNGVGPGATVTNVLSHLPPEQERLYRALPEEVPLGRQSSGEDVAGAVVFLASDDAAYITGVTINVDGGLSAAAIDRVPPGGLW